MATNDLKRLKAELRQMKRIVKLQEKDLDIVDRIVGIVRDSVEAMPAIVLPELPVFGESQNEEVALLLLSDAHIGKKTKTYNSRVFAKRLGIASEPEQLLIGVHPKFGVSFRYSISLR